MLRYCLFSLFLRLDFLNWRPLIFHHVRYRILLNFLIMNHLLFFTIFFTLALCSLEWWFLSLSDLILFLLLFSFYFHFYESIHFLPLFWSIMMLIFSIFLYISPLPVSMIKSWFLLVISTTFYTIQVAMPLIINQK